MNDKLDIYFSKVFCRMRHKTQLFNGAADDHYHTRLQHTIEVEEIALRMAKGIMKNVPSVKCDLNKVSAIALLHDIGHTPFGHAGEKALHEMVSGKYSSEYDLPNFIDLGVAIGFKHNINSGLLYIENAVFNNVDIDILDGIVKHTKLTQKKNDGLDYGFEYIFNYYTKRFSDYYLEKNPKTIEGFIVVYADEIAQICSDYLDICLDCDSRGKNVRFDCAPYNKLSSYCSEKRINAKEASNYLIDKFVNCFKRNQDFNSFKTNSFGKIINDFDKARRTFIESNESIVDYDNKKKEEIRILFTYYYNHPEALTNDFFGDFVYRVKRIKFDAPSIYWRYIDALSSDKSEVIALINEVKEIVGKSNSGFSNRNLKEFRQILKMFIRSVAVHISKMTDNYADHKYTKIVDNQID